MVFTDIDAELTVVADTTQTTRARIATGMAYSMVPEEILRAAGVAIERHGLVYVSDLGVARRPIGTATLRIDKAEVRGPVIFGPKDSLAYIGLSTLTSCFGDGWTLDLRDYTAVKFQIIEDAAVVGVLGWERCAACGLSGMIALGYSFPTLCGECHRKQHAPHQHPCHKCGGGDALDCSCRYPQGRPNTLYECLACFFLG